MKVYFITEYGPGIGSGHLMRMLSLSEAFEQRDLRPEFIVHAQGAGGGVLGDRRLRILDWHEDREALQAAIRDSDIAVVDSYRADEDTYEAIAAGAKLTVYMDDENRLDYPPGLVVNGALGAEDIAYPAQQEKDYLLGTSYVPLRKAFWQVSGKHIAPALKRVLITFGGSDPRRLSARVLRLLCTQYPDWNKTVVIGEDFEQDEALTSLKGQNVEEVYFPDDEGMKALMLASDLVISAGGQTVYECARVGVPLIAIAVSNNQGANVMAGQKAGFLEDAGSWEDPALPERILEKLNLLKDKRRRERMQGIGKGAVDGLGAQRTVRAVLKRYIRDHAILRPVGVEDMVDLYALANDPEVRALSFHQEQIALGDHKEWFADKLMDPRCRFFAAETGGLFLGSIRFDLAGPLATVSLSATKKWRGLGLGQWMLQEAIAILKGIEPEIVSIQAMIKAENTVSMHLFASLGFEFSRDEIIAQQKAKVFAYSIKVPG